MLEQASEIIRIFEANKAEHEGIIQWKQSKEEINLYLAAKKYLKKFSKQ
jgi:hypothetical protein